MSKNIELSELLKMSKEEIKEVFRNGHPIKQEELDNTQYLGIDVGMPNWFHKFFWKTFRKTFYRDPKSGVLRGWNVKLEQNGIEGIQTPKKNKKGEDLSFGHYLVLPAAGKKFPKGWQGADYLDYGVAGNKSADPAALGYCPLVAINEGSTDLLMGWEVFKIGSFFIPLSDFWILKREGPLEKVVAAPTSGN
jgi:hypothetical protein